METATVTPSLFVDTPRSSGPIGLAFDSFNNLYCSYFDTNSIVKISPNRSFTTIIASNSGLLNRPNGLAFDSLGNLYCVNHGSNAIPGNSSIIKFNPNVSPIVVTTIASNTPNDIGLFRGQQLAFDSFGNLYCACYGSQKIIKITPSNVVSTFINLGTGGPYGLAFDSLGNLYCSLFDSRKIIKITTNLAVSDFVTSGLNGPAHLRFDSVGNLYCSNAIGNTITRITPNRNATIFSSNTTSETLLSNPRGSAFDSLGNLYVANYAGKFIRKYTITKVQTNLGTLNNINKTFGDLPFNIAIPSSNNPSAISFSSSNTSVATVSGNTVTIVGAGETTITVTQEETTDYTSASITITLTVTKSDIMLLKQKGYSAAQLKNAGYTINELLIGSNYTINELKQAGYPLNHNVITQTTSNNLLN